jgi:outer membrane protein assembly factor BamB
MSRNLLFIFVIFFVACREEKTPDPRINKDAVSVFTQHNDNYRSGLNDREKILTTSNVNGKQFGKLFTLPVDDQVYAQPLIVSNLMIGNNIQNVVFIATVNNSVYAFNADTTQLYWKKNFTEPGMRPVKNSDMTGACSGNYQDFSSNIGIVGTPVIDSISHTMYFVARSVANNNFVEYLHAIDIVTGGEKPGSPVKITATYTGGGAGSVNNVLTFDAQKENQRQGLTLVNGIVYITFAGHCDWEPYHGWILGYDSKTLTQKIVYNDTPEGSDGGIWESGMGMAADKEGNLYVAVGNGTVGLNGDPTNLINRGESAIKLGPAGNTLQVLSYFTPYNFQYLEDYDLDYGSMGALLIPNSNYFLTGGKDGNLYLLNKDNMGGYSPSANHVQQNVSLAQNAMLHAQPAYYKGASTEYVYVWSENEQLRSFPFDRTSNTFDVSQQKFSSVTGPVGESGAMLSTSSNGNLPGTGIVWASHPVSGDANQQTRPGILRAFDAEDVTKELWNNNENTADNAGNYAKFSSPTIANGHVYLATFSNQVVVYGLK